MEAVREGYLKGSREEKGQILEEFTRLTGYHRKAAIRPLNRESKPVSGRRRLRIVEVAGHPMVLV